MTESGVGEDMTACFRFGDEGIDCYREVNVTVTLCDDYYVYYLPDPVACFNRYCAEN